MINIDKLIPKDKEDVSFIDHLKLMQIEDIRHIVPNLLEWIQDGNWIQAKLIINYFSPHINEIENEIITILKGDDSTWKYWTLSGLIYHSNVEPSNNLFSVINDLYINPTVSDKEEEVDIVANEILEKYKK